MGAVKPSVFALLAAVAAAGATNAPPALPEYRPAWSGLRDPGTCVPLPPGAGRFRPAYSAAPGSDQERIEELERRVRELRLRLDELERGRRTW